MERRAQSVIFRYIFKHINSGSDNVFVRIVSYRIVLFLSLGHRSTVLQLQFMCTWALRLLLRDHRSLRCLNTHSRYAA